MTAKNREKTEFSKPRSLENRGIASLIPFARNSRTHSESQIAQIAASIREFGWTNPLLIDPDGNIIAGHGRLLAARKLELTEVPCIVLEGLSDAQRRALVIADNKLALNAGWDEELLASELKGLLDLDFDLGVIGFEKNELDFLFSEKTGRSDPDHIPAAPLHPISRSGDVWLLGNHRIVCGDCTNTETLALALDGAKADCVFTSPPYGVGIDYGETYDDTLENISAMLPVMAELWIGNVEKGGFAVVNFNDIVTGRDASHAAEPCEYPMALKYFPAFRAAGWFLWSRRIWCKPNARTHSPWVIKSNRAASDWEHVWTFKAPGKSLIGRTNGKSQSANGWFDTTSEHGVDIGKNDHGAGMAVALPLRMIEIHSRKGRTVLEPFLGTGTTLIAAEMTGRNCAASEINPAYVDISVIRWQEFTGRQAVHADGRLFDHARTKEAA